MKIHNAAKSMAALAISLGLAIGATIAVPASQTGQIVGENDVTEMVINVIVPTSLDFTLDPLEVTAQGGSQVLPHDYFFINKTGAPVKVSLSLEASLSEETELVASPSSLAKDDAAVTDKKLFFAMLGADSIEAGDLSFENATHHTAKGIYDKYKDTIIPFDAESRSSAITFALAPAAETEEGGGYDALAEENKGIGAFQFYAELNTYASWEAGDIGVTGYYSLTPLRSSTYDKYLEEGGFTDGGWGAQLKPENPEDLITGADIFGEPAETGQSEELSAEEPAATEPPASEAVETQPATQAQEIQPDLQTPATMPPGILPDMPPTTPGI